MKKLAYIIISLAIVVTMNQIVFACAPIPSLSPITDSQVQAGSQVVHQKIPPLVRLDTNSYFFPDCKTYFGPLYSWEIIFRNGISIPFLLAVALVIVIGLLLFLVRRRNLKKLQ